MLKFLIKSYLIKDMMNTYLKLIPPYMLHVFRDCLRRMVQTPKLSPDNGANDFSGVVVRHPPTKTSKEMN